MVGIETEKQNVKLIKDNETTDVWGPNELHSFTNWTEIQYFAYAFKVLPAFITEWQKMQHAIELNYNT